MRASAVRASAGRQSAPRRRAVEMFSVVVMFSVVAGACDGFGDFVGDRMLLRCQDTFPVCQTTAGCVVNEDQYLEGSFPGQRSFIVQAPADSVIVVEMLLTDQTASGFDTEIRWNEPGCFDFQTWNSFGQDIFLLAGQNNILSEGRQIFESGDHLIEVFSDAVVEYQLRIKLNAPD